MVYFNVKSTIPIMLDNVSVETSSPSVIIKLKENFMKNNQDGFSIIEVVLVLAAVLLIGGTGWYVWVKNATDKKNTTKNSQQNITEGSRVTYTGNIKSVDLSAMPTDGSGVFVINADNLEVTIHLSSGQSTCDRTAITVPNVKVNDNVKVSGDKASDGIVRVCESGTYIQAQNSKISTVSISLIVKISGNPIANTSVNINSYNGINCIQAPCPTNSKTWEGKTDGNGLIYVPIENLQVANSVTPQGYRGKSFEYDKTKTSYQIVFER